MYTPSPVVVVGRHACDQRPPLTLSVAEAVVLAGRKAAALILKLRLPTAGAATAACLDNWARIAVAIAGANQAVRGWSQAQMRSEMTGGEGLPAAQSPARPQHGALGLEP